MSPALDSLNVTIPFAELPLEAKKVVLFSALTALGFAPSSGPGQVVVNLSETGVSSVEVRVVYR